MPTATRLRDELESRAHVLKETFGLSPREDLTTVALDRLELSDEMAQRLAEFNIEWHVIPPTSLVRFDGDYLKKMYPRRARNFDDAHFQAASVRGTLEIAHARIQGAILGVETTQKPGYLPGNTQFYGTTFGHDPACDPFRPYIEKAGLSSGPRFINSRFSQTPATLRVLGEVVNADWKARGLIPPGYQLNVCPPTVFNLVGSLFHREWSETATLELTGYRDDRGNGVGLAVGATAPGDFSYVRRLDVEPDLSLLGFRVALVPIP